MEWSGGCVDGGKFAEDQEVHEAEAPPLTLLLVTPAKKGRTEEDWTALWGVEAGVPWVGGPPVLPDVRFRYRVSQECSTWTES